MTDSATIQGLLAAFRELPPWRGTDLSAEDRRRSARTARHMQNSDPADAERALALFLDEAGGFTGVENETRLFLLMRFVFDLPDRVPASQRRVFKGWINWPAPDAGGIVNLSWPINWQHGQPTILAPYAGAEGPRYGAIEEYRYLLGHFPFRKIGAAEE